MVLLLRLGHDKERRRWLAHIANKPMISAGLETNRWMAKSLKRDKRSSNQGRRQDAGGEESIGLKTGEGHRELLNSGRCGLNCGVGGGAR